MQEKLSDYSITLRGRQYKPLMVGGMGVNISSSKLVLAVEKLGGIAHLSDALLMDVCDRELGTHYSQAKTRRFKDLINNPDKSEESFDLEDLAAATKQYISHVMSQKTGRGLVLLNCMEKLTMNAAIDTLRVRLNAALDAGIDGITMGAGLHLSSLRLMKDNPRFHEALLGIIVSSVRALKVFIQRANQVERLPDYVVVEGPLAGGHLGFGDDWADYNLEDIVRDVRKFLDDNAMPQIPVFAAGGIFTGGDASMLYFDDQSLEQRIEDLKDRCVMDFATRQVVCARPEQSIARVAALLAKKKFKKLPVVDDEGKLVGVIRRSAITKYIFGILFQ